MSDAHQPRDNPSRERGVGGGNHNYMLWLAAIGVACAVAGPVLLSPYAVQAVGEGSVGVLRFGGRLLDETKPPGYHFVLPLLYELTEAPVNVRTTEIRDVECGTSGGVLVRLPSVEVIHRLNPASVVSTLRAYEDYEQTWIIQRVVRERDGRAEAVFSSVLSSMGDRGPTGSDEVEEKKGLGLGGGGVDERHDLNKICARHSLHEVHIDKFDQLDDMLVAALKETAAVWVPGLMIIAARVAKPAIPQQLQGDFVRVEEEISKLKVAHQHEQLVVRNAENEGSKQVLAAEKNRDIRSMTMAREVEEKEADLHIQRIQDEMHVSRSKDHADATSYSKLREAEGNERRLSPAFLELARQKALFQNLEAYYGDRMPEYIRSSKRSSTDRRGGEEAVHLARWRETDAER